MEAAPRQHQEEADVLEVVAAAHHDEVHAPVGEMGCRDDPCGEGGGTTWRWIGEVGDYGG